MLGMLGGSGDIESNPTTVSAVTVTVTGVLFALPSLTTRVAT